MTELSALLIRIEGKSSGAEAAASKTVSALGKVDAAAKKTSAGVGQATGSIARLGRSAGGAGVGVQQFGWQFSQMGQSIAAGTPPIQAFTMQLGDLLPMLGIGGLAGVAVTAAAVMAPLAGAFLSGEDASKKFGDAVDAMADQVGAFKTAAEEANLPLSRMIEKFGTSSPVLAQALSDLAAIEKIKAFEAIDATADSMAELIATMSSDGGMAGAVQSFLGFQRNSEEARVAAYNFRVELERLAASEDPIEKLRGALNMRDLLVASAGSYKDMNAEQRSVYDTLTKIIVQLQLMGINITDATTGMSAFGDAASGAQGPVSVLVAQTRALAEAAMAADAAMSAMAPPDMTPEGGFSPSLDRFGNPYAGEGGAGPKSSPRPPRRPDLVAGIDWGFATPARSGGGGGKAKENPLIDDLEQLRESLLTQEAAQVESYMRQQETLRSALEQKLLTQQEYNALMEQAQTQHQEAMSQIDAYRYGDAALKFQTFMGDMASALSGGNDKMMRIARVFGAFEATINAWRAYNQTLADPSLPFFAKFAAAASVLSAGLGAVNAIKGGGGGGRGGSSAAAAGGSAQAPQQVNLNTYGGGDFIRGADFGMMLDKLNQEAGDRGYKLMWNPS